MYLDEPLYHVFLRNSSATREIPGKVVMGLPVRREIIEIMKNHGVACSMRAERVFLDQCITYSKRTVEEQYREIAIKEFLDYMKENGISVLKNREIEQQNTNQESQETTKTCSDKISNEMFEQLLKMEGKHKQGNNTLVAKTGKQF